MSVYGYDPTGTPGQPLAASGGLTRVLTVGTGEVTTATRNGATVARAKVTGPETSQARLELTGLDTEVLAGAFLTVQDPAQIPTSSTRRLAHEVGLNNLVGGLRWDWNFDGRLLLRNAASPAVTIAGGSVPAANIPPAGTLLHVQWRSVRTVGGNAAAGQVQVRVTRLDTGAVLNPTTDTITGVNTGTSRLAGYHVGVPTGEESAYTVDVLGVRVSPDSTTLIPYNSPVDGPPPPPPLLPEVYLLRGGVWRAMDGWVYRSGDWVPILPETTPPSTEPPTGYPGTYLPTYAGTYTATYGG